MATLTLNIDLRQEKNGMAPIRIRINHRGTSAFYKTGISVEPRYFDGQHMDEPILSRAVNADEKNRRLSDMVTRFSNAILSIKNNLRYDIDTMTATDVRAYVTGAETKKYERAKPRERVVGERACCADFMDWLDKFGQSKEGAKTRQMYQYAWHILNEYLNDKGMLSLLFTDIDYPMLKELRVWIGDSGRGESVRHQVESCIRAAWNEARRMKIILTNENPFQYYKIERVYEPEEIDFAPIEEIRKMMRFDLSGIDGEKWLTEARDLLMLSWCLCGANLIDIYNMSKPKDGEFVFVRHKISQRHRRRSMHIRIEPEMQELIDKYCGSDMAFCFKDDSASWDTFQRKVNDRVKRLGKLSGTNVTFQRLRRSWGTYALRMTGNPLIVDASMGHMPNTILTQHYGAHDWGDTAKCNRQMIDLLNE